MKGWLGRLGREWQRQTALPNAGNRLSGVHTSAAPPPNVVPTTRVAEDGRGKDLFLIGRDKIGDATKYLGNDPLPEDER